LDRSYYDATDDDLTNDHVTWWVGDLYVYIGLSGDISQGVVIVN